MVVLDNVTSSNNTVHIGTKGHTQAPCGTPYQQVQNKLINTLKIITAQRGLVCNPYKITSNRFRPPKFYRLPKIHKDTPSGPIVSSKGTVFI